MFAPAARRHSVSLFYYYYSILTENVNIFPQKIFLFLLKKYVDKGVIVWYYNYRTRENLKGREDKKMYEFEIIYKCSGEHDFLYGYSLRDLARRYPEIDPNSYKVIYREYID